MNFWILVLLTQKKKTAFVINYHIKNKSIVWYCIKRVDLAEINNKLYQMFLQHILKY